LNRGNVEAYAQDKDGLRRLRKWRIPAAPYIPYELDDENEIWGILVGDHSDLTQEVLIGDVWGDLVQIAGQHAMLGADIDFHG